MNNRAVEVNAVRVARRELTPVIPLALVGDFSWLKFSLNMDDVNARHLQEGQAGFLRFPDREMMAKAYDTDFGAGNKERGIEIKAVLKEIVPRRNRKRRKNKP